MTLGLSGLVNKVVISVKATQMIPWWLVLWGDWDQSILSIRDSERYHKREKIIASFARRITPTSQPLLCVWCM